MNTANIVILESSKEFLDELKDYFDGKEQFNVCAVTGNGTKGIEYINHYKPNIVILNLVLLPHTGQYIHFDLSKLSPCFL